MFGTIRRHQTWLWGIIITLTIISFVIFFSPYTRTSRNAGGSEYLGSINGERITRQDFNNAYREALLQYYFTAGSWLSEAEKKNSFDPERSAYQRLFVVQKQEDMGIHIGSDTAGQFATGLLQARHFTPQDFAERILRPHGLTMEDLDRFVRHELGIQELINTVGLSGKLITTQEVKAVYLRENEALSTQAAFFSGSNYLSQVAAPAEAVAQFFTNRQAFYRLPERVQVTYVRFPTSNYLAKAEKESTNLNEQVELQFQRVGSNYLKEAKSPEEAKSKIKQELLEYQGWLDASKDARSFASKLNDFTNAGPDALEMVAKSNGLPVQVSPPFDKENPPKELDVAPNFAKIAFGLTQEEPIPGPVAGREAVIVMALNKKLPSESPSFETVKDKVTFDYKYSEALKLARKAGADFDKLATNAMAQGKTFDAICAEAKIKPVTLPPCALSTKDVPEVEEHMDIRQFKEIAFSTPVGKLSGFQPTLDGGIELFVQSKAPPDENKMNTELPRFVAQVRQARQSRAFEAWFSKEASKGLADIPYFQQQQKQKQQMSGRSAKPS